MKTEGPKPQMLLLGYLLSNGFPWARIFLQMLLYYSLLGVQCILGDPSWKGEIKKSEHASSTLHLGLSLSDLVVCSCWSSAMHLSCEHDWPTVECLSCFSWITGCVNGLGYPWNTASLVGYDKKQKTTKKNNSGLPNNNCLSFRFFKTLIYITLWWDRINI